MKLRYFISLIAAAFMLLAAPQAEARDVYVRLSASPSCSVASDSNMTLTDASGKRLNLGKSASISAGGGRASVGKSSFKLPVKITSGGLIKYNKRRYRGALMLTSHGLLNVLDLELYLRGVLPAEAGASWPQEALRAQAIISRTYVLRQSLNRSKRGYDVTDTVSDQVYKGAGVEKDSTNSAVASTEREVLLYGSSLAFTPFHSDSGGFTANNSDVWGKHLPYLTTVREPIAYQSPNSSWSAKIPRSKIESAVSKLSGANIAPITEVRVSKVDGGGRAVNLSFKGAKGAVRTVSASRFRTAVGPNLLKSTMLTPSAVSAPQQSAPVQVQTRPSAPAAPLPQTSSDGDELTVIQEAMLARMTSDGVFTAKELIDMISSPSKKKEYFRIGLQRSGQTEPEFSRTVPPVQPQQPAAVQIAPAPSYQAQGSFSIRRDGDNFIFSGRGWGHGVGLSQWGCMTLAKNGWNAERILAHYYPGAEVKRYK